MIPALLSSTRQLAKGSLKPGASRSPCSRGNVEKRGGVQKHSVDGGLRVLRDVQSYPPEGILKCIWLQEVQAQIRVGNLDVDSHAFLHGEPTSVPGSWLRNDVQCGNSACRELKDSCSPCQIQEKECKICQSERDTRRRVARGPTDEQYRLQFDRAAAIFATNDIKHHVNKVRAAAFANERHLPLVLLPAKDYISAPALREKPELKKCKKQWLKRHDRNCGGLYGLLPLCVGMPVRLTEHLDRGEKGLLKGRLGTVKGWLSENGVDIGAVGTVHVFKKSPDVIWVDFADATTTLGILVFL